MGVNQRRPIVYANPQPVAKLDARADFAEPAFRTPTTFRQFSAAVASVGTPVVVWTPATGNRFRLMGWSYSSGGTGAAVFKEASVAVSVGSLWTNPSTALNVVVNSPPNLANGIFAASRNNPLVVDSTVAGITYTGTVFGTEETGD